MRTASSSFVVTLVGVAVVSAAILAPQAKASTTNQIAAVAKVTLAKPPSSGFSSKSSYNSS
jgi:hypothetical protein